MMLFSSFCVLIFISNVTALYDRKESLIHNDKFLYPVLAELAKLDFYNDILYLFVHHLIIL